MLPRSDTGGRKAGEKAQLPDEFITRSQIVAGTNIRFDYLDNHDIVINALGARTVNGQAVRRTLTAVVTLYDYPDTARDSSNVLVIPATPVNFEQKHLDADVNGSYTAVRKSHMFRSQGVRIYHNWNIPLVIPGDATLPGHETIDHRCRYVYTLTDASGIVGKGSDALRTLVELVPIDSNTVLVRRRGCVGNIYPEGGFGTVNYGQGNVSRTRLNNVNDYAHRMAIGDHPLVIVNMMEVQ